jgi:hypothetical protein
MRKALIALSALTLAAAAHANQYGLVSVGSAKVDFNCAGATTCDKSGVGFKLLGGYKFTPNLALEGGYMDYGKLEATVGGVGGNIKANGFGIGGAFHQDLTNEWNVVLRAGLASMKAKASGGESKSSTQPYLGAGIGYRITPAMSIDGAVDISRAKLADQKGDLRMFSVGLTVGF